MTTKEEVAALREEVAELREKIASLTEAMLHAIVNQPVQYIWFGPPVVPYCPPAPVWQPAPAHSICGTRPISHRISPSASTTPFLRRSPPSLAASTPWPGR